MRYIKNVVAIQDLNKNLSETFKKLLKLLLQKQGVYFLVNDSSRSQYDTY
jgi:hypothetical protein